MIKSMKLTEKLPGFDRVQREMGHQSVMVEQVETQRR